ncbi:hypothetical protein CPB83DRAFT_901271 [Crepidotus variabilis]|uniref:ferroxidase n=1 Tax=Crepidotus variabilis TaxID=179855 RepID=A0A9P6EV46_9AGAR|nr:hypothetical protein CPB83DRAFT_901271 [Crepidotus variabilis]
MLSSTLRPLARCTLNSTRRISLRACLPTRTHRTSTNPRLLLPRRTFATPPPQVNESDMTMHEYHAESDQAMEDLMETLEELVDESEESDYEVEYHAGVLTLKVGENGTYVINKQPPNKQIWLSSPKSGPKRYDFHKESGRWRYSRDGQTIDDLLSEELSDIFNQPVVIDVGGL